MDTDPDWQVLDAVPDPAKKTAKNTFPNSLNTNPNYVENFHSKALRDVNPCICMVSLFFPIEQGLVYVL